jgi:hypothetical protein
MQAKIDVHGGGCNPDFKRFGGAFIGVATTVVETWINGSGYLDLRSLFGLGKSDLKQLNLSVNITSFLQKKLFDENNVIPNGSLPPIRERQSRQR